MKTKDYVIKFKLNINDKFNHSEFVSDLANDFVALLELNKAQDNIKGFENALRAIRMKFDAINNKTVGIIPEKLWNYFFATVVVKLREELCPKDMQRRKELSEEKRKAYESRKEFERLEFESFQEYYWSSFTGFLGSLFKREKAPLESFKKLGFENDDVEIKIVKHRYHKLAIQHHPDNGGKQDDFIEIAEAKNKCIQWLESKQNKS